jgi:hypothetical protein
MVLKELFSSEKAIFCLALLAAASALAALGHMPVAEWREFATWIAGIYVVGKAVQGGASAIGRGKTEAAELASRVERLEAMIEGMIEGEAE